LPASPGRTIGLTDHQRDLVAGSPQRFEAGQRKCRAAQKNQPHPTGIIAPPGSMKERELGLPETS
jgi:hypothetical protein